MNRAQAQRDAYMAQASQARANAELIRQQAATVQEARRAASAPREMPSGIWVSNPGQGQGPEMVVAPRNAGGLTSRLTAPPGATNVSRGGAAFGQNFPAIGAETRPEQVPGLPGPFGSPNLKPPTPPTPAGLNDLPVFKPPPPVEVDPYEPAMPAPGLGAEPPSPGSGGRAPATRPPSVVGTDITDRATQAMQLGYAGGGYVDGPGPVGVDSVDAKLAPGEYVLPPAAVELLGGVEALNRLVEQATGQPPTHGEPRPDGKVGLAGAGSPWLEAAQNALELVGNLNPAKAGARALVHSAPVGEGSDRPRAPEAPLPAPPLPAPPPDAEQKPRLASGGVVAPRKHLVQAGSAQERALYEQEADLRRPTDQRGLMPSYSPASPAGFKFVQDSETADGRDPAKGLPMIGTAAPGSAAMRKTGADFQRQYADAAQRAAAVRGAPPGGKVSLWQDRDARRTAMASTGTDGVADVQTLPGTGLGGVPGAQGSRGTGALNQARDERLAAKREAMEQERIRQAQLTPQQRTEGIASVAPFLGPLANRVFTGNDPVANAAAVTRHTLGSAAGTVAGAAGVLASPVVDGATEVGRFGAGVVTGETPPPKVNPPLVGKASQPAIAPDRTTGIAEADAARAQPAFLRDRLGLAAADGVPDDERARVNAKLGAMFDDYAQRGITTTKQLADSVNTGRFAPDSYYGRIGQLQREFGIDQLATQAERVDKTNAVLQTLTGQGGRGRGLGDTDGPDPYKQTVMDKQIAETFANVDNQAAQPLLMNMYRQAVAAGRVDERNALQYSTALAVHFGDVDPADEAELQKRMTTFRKYWEQVSGLTAAPQ